MAWVRELQAGSSATEVLWDTQLPWQGCVKFPALLLNYMGVYNDKGNNYSAAFYS